MSNKLVEHKESKEILTGNQKKILFWICFIILSIVFITVWINILLTSKAFKMCIRDSMHPGSQGH